MKSSEAKPLDKEELQTLKDLLQRWILVTYPFYGGSSEESDASTTYGSIKRDVEKGEMDVMGEADFRDAIDSYGQRELK